MTVGSILSGPTVLFWSHFSFLSWSVEETESQHTMLQWYQTAKQGPWKNEPQAFASFIEAKLVITGALQHEEFSHLSTLESKKQN